MMDSIGWRSANPWPGSIVDRRIAWSFAHATNASDGPVDGDPTIFDSDVDPPG